uniref:Gustatory receptor n=1 Tax=Heliothis virescens TaxID=7102 RepID=A0A2A4JFH7_HELVI
MKVHELSMRRPNKRCGLHVCLRHAMRLARWTGFFPVQGLGQPFADGTRFNIKSLYFIYNFTTLLGQLVMACFSIVLFFQTEVTLNSISNVIFYSTSLTSAVLFLKLAKQWPILMAKALETEQALTELKLKNKVVVKCCVIAYVAMTVALVEHILCTSFNITFVMHCLKEAGITTNVMENYVVHRMPYVFNYIPYSLFGAFLFEFLCLQSTFVWSFNDVFITCFSVYITAYFRNLNKVVTANSRKDKDMIPWSTLRVHYSKLVKLVKEIDAQISSFILLTFFTDLFYICLQLFNSLHRNYVSFKYCNELQTKQALTSPSYLLYYLYSVVFLVLRAMMMSLFASNVHCASLEPAHAVYDVPSALYDNEVRRFQLQLHHTKVALTGKFFYVTRNMVLKVVGTIITYEIVLLQYTITPNPYYNGTKAILNISSHGYN